MNIKYLFPGILLMAAIFVGCAPQYHKYADCVPYNHCPQPPLPYTTYDGCPTPLAERFAQEHATPIESAMP